VIAALLAAAAGGCYRASRTVALATLETAPRAVPVHCKQVIATNPAGLRALCVPLGPRLGLIQVRAPQEWRQLAEQAPELGAPPDLQTGIVIGLVSFAGSAVDGGWPIQIESVRVYEGAGLVYADFHGGTYLPDGTVRCEIAQVPGLRTVLVVDVDGTTFIPEQGSSR
jgi:hypothetical protein